jgi:hypothetical protein
MNAPPPKPNWNAGQRAALVHAMARDILIRARILELRRLAEQTTRGELPAPDEDPPDNDK